MRLNARLARALLSVAVLLAAASSARASDFSEDLKARRARMMERLGPETMLILFSAPERQYSGDVDYEYHQNSNLYYLTGVTQDSTILVLMPGNASRREVLFVRDRDPVREHWEGHLLSREEATAKTGISTILLASQFEPFIAGILGQRGFAAIDDKEAATFFSALGAGRARVALALDPGGVDAPLTRPQELARSIRDRYVGFQTIDATPLLVELRIIKTPYERQLLAKSYEIAGEAQLAGMHAARPDAWEYEVEAAIEAVHRQRGAASQSYPSIVGSGPNATILHYTENTRQMQAGELLLVDAGCAYEYMASDVTRTYPVSGRFTQAQKDIYSIVLQAQDAGMAIVRAGTPLTDVHNKTVEIIKAGLLKLGLITDASGDQYRMWYTHGANHYVGLDVHDVGARTRPLEPGMTFVIEPGIYIRQSALDNLPRTLENMALIEKIQSAVTKYKDIGVRIEDGFLLEESGLRRLSAPLPRTIEEIETFLTTRTAPASAQR
jgi:Xaa-Pro aminopeptidase